MDLVAALRRTAFVFLSACIVVVSSERIFWYWSTNPLEHLAVAAFYAPAIGGALWLIGRYRVRGLWGVMLAAPVFGYLVEGVLTPVLYSGGPFVPFFPVWFAFWHGVIGLVLLWYLFRRWLVSGAWQPLLVASSALGAFWGTWAMTSLLPENINDPELVADAGGPLQPLDPVAFAWYALAFSAILAAAHYLLGRGLWVASFEPGRPTRWLWLAATAAIVLGWTLVVPWAAPMLALYVGIQVWALRRHRRSGDAGGIAGVPVLDELAGPVTMRSLAPIAALPIVAAFVYTLWWNVDPPEDVVRYGLMYGTIGVQTVLGAVLMAVSLLRLRRDADRPVAPPPWPPPAPTTMQRPVASSGA